MSLTTLPAELLLEIIERTTANDFEAITLTCQRLYAVARDGGLSRKYISRMTGLAAQISPCNYTKRDQRDPYLPAYLRQLYIQSNLLQHEVSTNLYKSIQTITKYPNVAKFVGNLEIKIETLIGASPSVVRYLDWTLPSSYVFYLANQSPVNGFGKLESLTPLMPGSIVDLFQVERAAEFGVQFPLGDVMKLVLSMSRLRRLTLKGAVTPLFNTLCIMIAVLGRVNRLDFLGLEKLEYLNYNAERDRTYSCIEDIIPLFWLPALKEVDLEGLDSYGSNMSNAQKLIASRNFVPALTKLSIRHLGISKDLLSKLLDNLPNLKHLALNIEPWLYPKESPDRLGPELNADEYIKCIGWQCGERLKSFALTCGVVDPAEHSLDTRNFPPLQAYVFDHFMALESLCLDGRIWGVRGPLDLISRPPSQFAPMTTILPPNIKHVYVATPSFNEQRMDQFLRGCSECFPRSYKLISAYKPLRHTRLENICVGFYQHHVEMFCARDRLLDKHDEVFARAGVNLVFRHEAPPDWPEKGWFSVSNVARFFVG